MQDVISLETEIFRTLSNIILKLVILFTGKSRSQWPRCLRRRSAAACLLRSWVRIPPGAWIFVCCECCVLSGRGLYDELITRPEESYRLWCVVVCDLETSRMRRPWPELCRSATEKKNLLERTAEVVLKCCLIFLLYLSKSRLLKGVEQVTMPKTLQAIWW